MFIKTKKFNKKLKSQSPNRNRPQNLTRKAVKFAIYHKSSSKKDDLYSQLVKQRQRDQMKQLFKVAKEEDRDGFQDTHMLRNFVDKKAERQNKVMKKYVNESLDDIARIQAGKQQSMRVQEPIYTKEYQQYQLVTKPPERSQTAQSQYKTKIEISLEKREREENASSPYQKMLLKQRKNIIASRLFKFRDQDRGKDLLTREHVKFLKLQKRNELLYKEKMITKLLGKGKRAGQSKVGKLTPHTQDISYLLSTKKPHRTGDKKKIVDSYIVKPEDLGVIQELNVEKAKNNILKQLMNAGKYSQIPYITSLPDLKQNRKLKKDLISLDQENQYFLTHENEKLKQEKQQAMDLGVLFLLQPINYHKEHRNLTNPPGRQDTHNLHSWMKKMVTQIINNKGVDLNDYFTNIQTIYVSCFKEIIRQVTIECEERGILLERVLKGYRDLFAAVILDLNSRIQRQDAENKLKLQNMHHTYGIHISNMHKKLKKFENSHQKIEKEIILRTFEGIYLKKQMKQQYLDMQGKTNFGHFLMEQLEKASQEIAQLRSMIKKDVSKIFGPTMENLKKVVSNKSMRAQEEIENRQFLFEELLFHIRDMEEKQPVMVRLNERITSLDKKKELVQDISQCKSLMDLERIIKEKELPDYYSQIFSFIFQIEPEIQQNNSRNGSQKLDSQFQQLVKGQYEEFFHNLKEILKINQKNIDEFFFSAGQMMCDVGSQSGPQHTSNQASTQTKSVVICQAQVQTTPKIRDMAVQTTHKISQIQQKKKRQLKTLSVMQFMHNDNQELYRKQLKRVQHEIKRIGNISEVLSEPGQPLQMIGNLEFFDREFKKQMLTEDFTMNGLKTMNVIANEIHCIFDLNTEMLGTCQSQFSNLSSEQLAASRLHKLDEIKLRDLEQIITDLEGSMVQMKARIKLHGGIVQKLRSKQNGPLQGLGSQNLAHLMKITVQRLFKDKDKLQEIQTYFDDHPQTLSLKFLASNQHHPNEDDPLQTFINSLVQEIFDENPQEKESKWEVAYRKYIKKFPYKEDIGKLDPEPEPGRATTGQELKARERIDLFKSIKLDHTKVTNLTELNKWIFRIYERIEGKVECQDQVYKIIQRWFKEEYGECYEEKLDCLVNSVKFFRGRNKRVKHFGRLFGMQEDIGQDPVELQDVNCFFQALHHISKKMEFRQPGFSLFKDFTSDVMIPVDIGLSCLKQTFKGKFIRNELEEFIEEMKAVQQESILNNEGLMEINLDLFLDSIITHKSMDNGYVLKNIYSIFNACDLNADRTIDFFEFSTFIRPINYEIYTDNFLAKIFQSESPLPTTEGEEQKGLSMEQFQRVLMKKAKLSKLKFREFIQVRNIEEAVTHFQDLTEFWPTQQKVFYSIFRPLKSYKMTYRIFIKAVQIWVKKIQSGDPLKENQKEKMYQAWIVYRMLYESCLYQSAKSDMLKILPKILKTIEVHTDFVISFNRQF